MPHSSKLLLVLFLACAGALVALPAQALVTNYTDFGSYAAAAGAQSEITFKELPVGTFPAGPYPGGGGLFSFDGSDQIEGSGNFVTDGVGLDGHGDIDLLLPYISRSIGADFPGAVHFDLYRGSTLVGTSMDFGGGGTGFFGGIVSTESFDHVKIYDFVDHLAFVDNLYTASTPLLPEPRTLALLAMGLVGLGAAVRRRA